MTNIQRGAVLRTWGAADRMITGTATITGIAGQQLQTARTPILEVLVQNDPDSASTLRVGNVTGQYFKLSPGQSITVPINDLSQVYLSTDGGAATVNYIAMA